METIKTWQERLNDPFNKRGPMACIEDENRELRAALAKYEAQMLRMATCAGEFARDACTAPPAPHVERDSALLEQAAQACDQQADGTNGAYREGCLQCADAVRSLRDTAMAAQEKG